MSVASWAELLSEEAAAKTLPNIREKRYAAGAYICHRGDSFDYWAGVSEGLLKMSAISERGKAITYGGVTPGCWFGEGTILKNEPRRYDLVAIRETRLALLRRSTFMCLFESNLNFAQFVAHQLNERLGQFITTIESDRLHHADVRIARHIAALAGTGQRTAQGDVEISQEELGLLAGISRQSANCALAMLEANGLLKFNAGRVTVPDLKNLARYAAGE